MKIFRNRTVIGVLCILLALIICFGVTPLFSRSASEKTEIVRVTKDIKEGDEITAEMVQTVEVGAYNLPQNLMTDKKEVVGKYATADLAAGDYILSSKLSAVPAAENAYVTIRQEQNGNTIAVTFETKSGEETYELFKVLIGDDSSEVVGSLTDDTGTQRNVYLHVEELPADSGLEETEQTRFYAMQEDLNYLIDNLK